RSIAAHKPAAAAGRGADVEAREPRRQRVDAPVAAAIGNSRARKYAAAAGPGRVANSPVDEHPAVGAGRARSSIAGHAGDGGVVLQPVGSKVAVAGVIGRRTVAVQVNWQAGVPVVAGKAN